MGLQAALHMVYPPHCMTCDTLVTSDFGLCGKCWRDTPFIAGLVCDQCGVPLPGEDPGHALKCDDCLTIARPWVRGRSALLYRDVGRRIVLSLKHGDRLDLAKPVAAWMARAVAPILQPDIVVAPVPLHWLRLLKRRYNQAALLSGAVATATGLAHCPDLLVRRRNTGTQEGRDRDGRFANVADALRINAARAHHIKGRPVLLIDDVMTSGATLAAGSEACHAAGASSVSILVLARVAKDA